MSKDKFYIENFDSEDFMAENWSLNEAAPSYSEDFDLEDFGIYEELTSESSEGSDEITLTEDLQTSFPVRPMSDSEVRSAAKQVRKGAKVHFGYVKSLKLDSKFAQGKYVKATGTQYPVVKAIKVTDVRACTGVAYTSTEGAKLLHSTQEYQDKLAARQAAGLGGFGTNVHDTEAGLENILVTTVRGLKCLLAYPLSNRKPKNTYYISVAGEDWRITTKDEIAKYMSPAAAEEFLNPEAVSAAMAARQSQVYNNAGLDTMADNVIVIDVVTGEKLKVMTHPLNITYFDPTDPYKCIFQIDKESAVVPEAEADSIDPAEADEFKQEFPEPTED